MGGSFLFNKTLRVYEGSEEDMPITDLATNVIADNIGKVYFFKEWGIS